MSHRQVNVFWRGSGIGWILVRVKAGNGVIRGKWVGIQLAALNWSKNGLLTRCDYRGEKRFPQPLVPGLFGLLFSLGDLLLTSLLDRPVLAFMTYLITYS